MKYADGFLEASVFRMYEQMRKYLLACSYERNGIEKVDKRIENVLIPILEEKIVEDIKNGGEHKYESLKDKKCAMFLLDQLTFMSYNTVKVGGGEFKTDTHYSAELQGEKLLDMINNFVTMDSRSFFFNESKRPEFPSVKTDLLVKKLINMIDESIFTLEVSKWTNENHFYGNLEFPERAYHPIQQYLDANCDCLDYGTEAKYDQLYVDGECIEKIIAHIVIHRDSSDEEMNTNHIQIKLKTEEGKEKSFSLETTKELRKEFTKVFFENMKEDIKTQYKEHIKKEAEKSAKNPLLNE